MAETPRDPDAPRLKVLGDAPAGPEAFADLAPRPLPSGVHVSADGPVLYREWVVGPSGRHGWLFGVVLGDAIAIAGIALLASASGAPLRAAAGVLALLAGAALVLTAVSFRGLALAVDREGIRWSFGPFRRRYALSEITMFRARDFAFRKAGGWGIGRAFDGVDTYEVWGANGTALDIVVLRGGVSRHYLVSSVAPDQVCAALVRANAKRGG